MTGPLSVSVVVASHGRHLRLRWLLNALEEQTLAEPWEVIVVHDYEPPLASRILDSHDLATRGQLRHLTIPVGMGSPALQRNIGWRAARGELIAFTDDDCRPEPTWLKSLVTAARQAPGQVVQGATRPDPLERHILDAPHVRTMKITPPGLNAQTCNILYPQALLDDLDGFDEQAITGEDTGLALRAHAAGRSTVAAPDAIVNHAVEAHSLPGILRQNLKWHHLAYLVKQHPEMRASLTLWIFWDADHLRTVAALIGLAGARRHRASLSLAVPYFRRMSRRRGPEPVRRATAVAEIPGQAVRQVAEVLGMIAGSVRHRTILL